MCEGTLVDLAWKPYWSQDRFEDYIPYFVETPLSQLTFSFFHQEHLLKEGLAWLDLQAPGEAHYWLPALFTDLYSQEITAEEAREALPWLGMKWAPQQAGRKGRSWWWIKPGQLCFKKEPKTPPKNSKFFSSPNILHSLLYYYFLKCLHIAFLLEKTLFIH